MEKKSKGPVIVLSLLIFAAICGFIVWYILNQNGTTSAAAGTAYADPVTTLSRLESTGVLQRFTGVIESQETWSVEKSYDKTVSEVHVEVGDMVNVGDALVTYDTTDAQDSLTEGQIEVDRLTNTISSYNTKLEQLQTAKAKASADDQLTYSTEIQETQNLLRKAQYDLQKQQAANEQLQSSIDNATVTSELAGRVTAVNSTDNASDSSSTLITVSAVGEYRIKGTVNEQNLSSLTAGTAVLIRSRTDDTQVWHGTLTSIDLENPQQSSNDYGYSTTTQTISADSSSEYPFYVELDSIDGLMIGQHVYIEEDYGQADARTGIWLPACYIVQENGEAYVWAANAKDKIEKRTVTLGQYDEHQEIYEILDGLTLDDYIAYPGPSVAAGMDAEKNINQMAASGTAAAQETETDGDGEVSDSKTKTAETEADDPLIEDYTEPDSPTETEAVG